MHVSDDTLIVSFKLKFIHSRRLVSITTLLRGMRYNFLQLTPVPAIAKIILLFYRAASASFDSSSFSFRRLFSTLRLRRAYVL